MKTLVLSDIHYPFTDRKRLASIINEEKPNTTIFLGDNVSDAPYAAEFLRFMKEIGCRDYVLIRGDNDISLPYEKEAVLNFDGRSFKFVHGYQFNIGDDRTTGRIVTILKKINESLPVLAYAILSKAKSRTNGYLILGHSHALAFFPRLKVACAGCLTTEENIYNDMGYIVITSGEGSGVTLNLKRLDYQVTTFEI